MTRVLLSPLLDPDEVDRAFQLVGAGVAPDLVEECLADLTRAHLLELASPAPTEPTREAVSV